MPRPPRWLRWVALGLALVVLAVAGVGWVMLRRLDNSIVADVTTARELERYEEQRPPPAPGDAKNVLLIGTDRAKGGGQRSDVAILLHLAGDRESATALSVPRDLMVDIPRCDGSAPRRAQFNWAYEAGGASCAIRTLEGVTGIRVDHHVVMDYEGFSGIVDALGGVEMCLDRPLNDRLAGLRLPAGRQTLTGEEALAYVRARKDLGDGSDTARVERQQQFLDALTREITDSGVLLNPAKLFPVLDAAASSITTDTRLDSLVKLYDLLREVRSVPSAQFRFLTVPRVSDPASPNRDVLRQPAANDLFKRLRLDRPLPGEGGGEAPGTPTRTPAADHAAPGPASTATTCK
ncbi:LCP family protein [Streptomyces sp. 6N223]|uniref:LCP family protein n=1 Tax=Streptomyces sp. 6N223 TaxID=3457412 RepID=UPI003FCF1588